MSVANDTRVAPTALPPPSLSLGRTLTGTNAMSGRSGSCSRFARNRRSPPAQIASSTSLSVAPRALAIARSRPRSYCWVANRRDCPTRLLSTECGAWYDVTARVEVRPRCSWVSTSALATAGVVLNDDARPRTIDAKSPTGSTSRGGRLRLVRLKKNGCSRSSGSSDRPRWSSRIPV